MGQTGQCSVDGVDHDEVESLEHVAQMRLALDRRPVGSEAVVDRDHGLVGDDVARDPTADADGRQSFAVGEAVDHDLAGFVRRQSRQDLAGLVDRVVAHPRASAVRTCARGADLDAHRALAPGLDHCIARLHQDGEVGGEELRALVGEPAQTVVLRVDLLGLVPDPRDVARGLGERRGKPERDRDAPLHVARAEPVDAVLAVDDDAARGQVGVGGHGVEVAADHDALGTTELRAGDDRVPVAHDVEVRQAAYGDLDGIGDRLLLQRLARDIDERLQEVGHVDVEVELGGLRHDREPSRPSPTPDLLTV